MNNGSKWNSILDIGDNQMRVKIEVEFDVVSAEDDPVDIKSAENAARLAVFHNLAFTNDGEIATPDVIVEVDGFGKFRVTIPTD
jgi:hypothetical protein